MNVHDLEDLKGKIKTCVAKLKIKYDKHKRIFSRLEEREKEWLVLELYARPAPPTSRPGRPASPWTGSSERTKSRKVSRHIKIYMPCFRLLILFKRVHFFLKCKISYIFSLICDHCTEELGCTAALWAKSSPGKADFSKVVQQSVKNQTLAGKSVENTKPYPEMMKAEEALALKINCDLSDLQYQVLRNSSVKQNAEIYLSVKVICDEKSKCYTENLESFRNICQVFNQ